MDLLIGFLAMTSCVVAVMYRLVQEAPRASEGDVESWLEGFISGRVVRIRAGE